jgi:class 3 adenylate cyclase
VHGVGIAAAVWIVQTTFAANARAAFGARLRRIPVAGEVAIRSLVMAAVVTVTTIGLQAALYADPLLLHWVTWDWFASTLPRLLAFSLVVSLLAGLVTEVARLIGAPLLASIILGTYQRPAHEELIVMFLDLAGSTELAEALGELRGHDLITRFFFDIDETIADHGAVHAYVGDEVIVSWPLATAGEKNARALLCFLAIERTIARVSDDYRREFAIVPRFRAGIHAGPVVISECGNTKRQLAYFGDTMNVAARLCEYCKALDCPLVVSGDLLRHVSLPADIGVGPAARVTLRGRQKPIDVHSSVRPFPSEVEAGTGASFGSFLNHRAFG